MTLRPAHSTQSPTRDLATLEDEITELAAHLNAATYRLLALIREFDERHGWSGAGMKSCAHWLNWKCGIAMGAAREKVRVAHALQGLTQISSALRHGRVSYSKVRAMTRVATSQNEDYLLMIADHGTASHVERLVRNYRKVKRSEALERANRLHAMRELNWYIDDDGSYVLKARLSPEQGARIAQALDTAMTIIHEEQRNAAEGVPAGTPIATRRADALERIADVYLSAEEGVITGGGRVSAETSRRLACDCGVVHWLENADGTALDIGRRTRSIPPAIRRALDRRDGGCRFPGCTARHHVDAHHLRHWADGGETRLDNLLLLCRHHHRLVHEGGYSLALDSTCEPVFTAPNGKLMPSGPDTRSRGNVFALVIANRREQIVIGPRTLVPRWYGDNMDDEMAVDGLIRRE